MPLFVKGMIALPVVTALALTAASYAAAHARLKLLLSASAAVASAAFLLHVAAYLTQNGSLIRVISSRATILLLAFAVPPMIWLALRICAHSHSFLARFVAGYIVLWPSAIALLAALFLLPGNDEKRAHKLSPLVGIARAVGLVLIALVLLHYAPLVGTWIDANVIGRFMDASFTPYLFGFPSSRLHATLVIYLCVLLVWQRLKRAHVAGRPLATSLAPLALAILAPLSLYLLASSFQTGRLATSGEAREYYEVQAWARASTPPNATFIVGGTSVYEGWRNFTHRAQVTVGGCGYYACTKTAHAEAGKAAEFTAKFGDPHASTVTRKGLTAFARTYGGDYAVRRKAWAPLDFPVAFQNAAYVVYDLR